MQYDMLRKIDQLDRPNLNMSGNVEMIKYKEHEPSHNIYIDTLTTKEGS